MDRWLENRKLFHARPLRSGRGHRPPAGRANARRFGVRPEWHPLFPGSGRSSRPAGGGDAFSAPFGRCGRLLFVPLAVGDAAPLCREPVCRRTLFHRIHSGVSCGLFRRLCFATGGVPARSAILGEAAVMARGTADLQDRLSGCPGSGDPAGAAGDRAGAGGAGQRPDRVLPGFHAGHGRDAQGADATPPPSLGLTGSAGGRDDLICGPRSVPPRVMPFRRWPIISRCVPAAAAMPRALCAAGALLATRAAGRCGPAPASAGGSCMAVAAPGRFCGPGRRRQA